MTDAIKNSTCHPKVSIDGAAVAAVGSSLLGLGLEWETSLLGSETDSRRLALPSATADNILDISEISILQGAKVLVIEAQPFLRVLKHRKFETNNWIHPIIGLNTQLNRMSRSLRRSIYVLIGSGESYRPNQWIQDRISESGDIKIDIDILEKIYPPIITPTPLSYRLDKMLITARVQNVRVLFVLMPTSAFASSHQGIVYSRSLEDRLADFSREHDVEVWSPGVIWADRYFRDHAHLNNKGRARFTNALRDYLADESS